MGRPRSSFNLRWAILGGVLFLVAMVHIADGSSGWLWPWTAVGGTNSAIWSLRLPRAGECLIGGALLGMAGAVFQAVFRNPLAEPYILGVSSGAAIGGAVAQVFHVFVAWNWLAGPLASTAAGLLTLPLVLAIGTSRRGYSTQTLLIGGVVLGFLLYAVNTLVMLLGGLDTNQTLRWLLGSATNAAAPKVWLLLFVFVVACLLLRPLTRSMNLLSAGEDQARILGVDPGRLHLQLLTITTISTAAVVGTMGIIGFIGLVAPHISRRCFGNDLRHGLWTSTAIGAVLLLCADACSKRLNEIPLGAFTAIVGAPVLLYLLRRD